MLSVKSEPEILFTHLLSTNLIQLCLYIALHNPRISKPSTSRKYRKPPSTKPKLLVNYLASQKKSAVILNYKTMLGKSLKINLLSAIQKSEKESEIPKDLMVKLPQAELNTSCESVIYKFSYKH